MAMLTSGEYSLTKKNVVQEKKSVVFIKFTDSAQRALDEFFRSAGLNSDEKPQIEFNEKTEGCIFIPTKKNGNLDKCVAKFKFDVTSNIAMQGTQGSFDCVQQKRNTKQLIALGQLSQRLRIHANEDVYETTKNRMAAIELEQRKNCTRQIDMHSTHINRKSKLDKIAKSLNTSTPPPVKSDEKETKSKAPELSNIVRSRTRSVYNPPQKMNTNVYKIRKPLRERIIQMLAVRPYKKGELQAVLKQEGVRDGDKMHIIDTLNSVSISRDNFYHLSKSAWNDVQEDWLFYTEQEKQIVQKNKLRNSTPPSSDSSSGISTCSNQSPSNTLDEKSPPSNYKRPGYINGIDGFQTKRQRISHYSRQEPAISSTKTLSTSTFEENNSLRCDEYGGPSSGRSHSVHNQQCSSAVPAISTIEFVPGETNNYSFHRKDTPPPIVSSTTEDDDSPHDENCIEDEFNEVSSSTRPAVASVLAAAQHPTPAPLANNCDRDLQFHKLVRQEPNPQLPCNKQYTRDKESKALPKFMKEFLTITNTEQRRKYKNHFNEVFKEYKSLHAKIVNVSSTFTQLGDSLRQHKKGTPTYQNIETEIVKKYHAMKENNSNFQNAKDRFEYLHAKLSHIKQLVYDYDAKNNHYH